MPDVNNILFNEDALNEELLINYLKGNLSGKDLQAVEQQIADSAFVNDAVEGLQSFSSDKKLSDYMQQLNKNLHRHLAGKKQKEEKRKIKHLSLIILAVVIIIVLCVLGYVVITMQKKKEATAPTHTTNTITQSISGV